MKSQKVYVSILCRIIISIIIASLTLNAKPPDEINLLYPPRAPEAPRIDGVLDDLMWQEQALERDFISYDPLYGEKLPYKTKVWMSYDNENLYFAFRCFDPEPEKIKTSVARRDYIADDDWVGLSLDSLEYRQSSCYFMVNPDGIQRDILNSAVSGEDDSPDLVWDSAAQINKEGYHVEIRIPLSSIRFKSGKEVIMGILFFRRISRLSMEGSWPDIKPGHGILNAHARAIFRELRIHLNLELLPSFTFGSDSERISNKAWDKHDIFREPGISMKYGITSSITADITINPDFSQVESDSFQVGINRRYPIFYSEKRPFFMEGMDIFSFFTIPYGYFPTPVHTRSIVDPLWGVKLTGVAGKTTFGILSAGDEWPGYAFDGETNPYEDKKAYFMIVRGKHSLGGENHIGVLYSGREFAGGHNRVAGTDFNFRFSKNHQFCASLLRSYSRDQDKGPYANDTDLNIYYSFQTRGLGIMTAFERIGQEFRMDSAFLRRKGISEGWIWIGPNLYPSQKPLSWLIRITPHLTLQRIHDHTTGMDDSFTRFAAEFFFTRQGFIGIYYMLINESWAQKTFDLKTGEIRGGVQLFNWLRLSGFLARGNQIFYYTDNPYKGISSRSEISLILQPNNNLNISFSLSRDNFFKKKEKIYEVNIINTRTTYQFNKYFFIRAIIRYDSYQKILLTDFLASFTFIPGTVIHMGYGGLYDRREWKEGQWLFGQGSLSNVKRSFFFKASYLWRF